MAVIYRSKFTKFLAYVGVITLIAAAVSIVGHHDAVSAIIFVIVAFITTEGSEQLEGRKWALPWTFWPGRKQTT